MKIIKILSFLFIVFFIFSLFSFAFADSISSEDLSSLSIEQLLQLREQIDLLLQEKGHVSSEKAYFDLERTSKGEEVSAVQERLKNLGYYSGLISGKFDSETQKAMKLFEKTNGLLNDGNASREDQVILFSEKAISNTVAVVSSTPSPKPTEDPELAAYELLDYDTAARYPDDVEGNKVLIKGKVIQTLGSRKNGFDLRVSFLGSSDVVYVSVPFDPGYNILENDKLYVYGQLDGLKSYTALLGQKITIPYIRADKIELK